MPPTPASVAAARLAPARPQDKFGFLRPFRTDAARDVARASGDALLASRAGQVVGSCGELPWRPRLNANLDWVRHIKNDDALAEFARAYVGQALADHLPEVVAVRVQPTRTDRLLQLVVTCSRAADVEGSSTFDVRASLRP